MHEFRTQFGAHVKHLRLSRKWSQDRFYLESGITKSYQSSIESGRARVTIDTIKKIADGLHIQVSELFEFEQSTTSIDAFKEKLKNAIDDSPRDITRESLLQELLSIAFGK